MRKRVQNILEVPQDILTKMFGRGMFVNRESLPVQIEVNTGLGLAFDESGAVVVDMEVDETRCSIFTQMTDSCLSIDGRKLVLKKIYTNFKIHRNYDGYILDIIPYEQFEKNDEVIMTDYGYASAVSRPCRENTPEAPNFYRK